ncbi:MAG: MBL fold metallo-hydrolase [Verrucomicrobia bacterium]|nr:MBL fold metallo-hydrolase [Verrucomicrobiota bacterium]MDA1067808.1 MBL fold metallo-hydrolase [Verrucomicrobiota bacterium]
MQIPIEDFYEDVLAKAARGLGLSTTQLSERSGLKKDAIREALRGNFVEEEAAKLAPILDLDPEALVLLGQKTWRPAEIQLSGLACFNSPFHDMTVNAYVVWDHSSKKAAIFDSGADASELLEFVKSEGLDVQGIWITHTHGDHIADVNSILKHVNCPVYVGKKEFANFGEPFDAGKTFSVGSLNIETRLTWGHAKGGITFVVAGLDRPVAIVGDALFAQSMGGGMVSYEDAIRTSGAEIMTLPDNTVVCPGHGPLTSVEEQKKVNPFFAGKY